MWCRPTRLWEGYNTWVQGFRLAKHFDSKSWPKFLFRPDIKSMYGTDMVYNLFPRIHRHAVIFRKRFLAYRKIVKPNSPKVILAKNETMKKS